MTSLLKLITCCLVLTAAAFPAHAADDDEKRYADSVSRLADGVAKWFADEERERLLTISSFVNDDNEQQSDIMRLLEQRLLKLDPAFKLQRADMVLSGRVIMGSGKANPKDDFKSVSTVILAELRERNKAIAAKKFEIPVFGDAGIQRQGLSVEFPKNLPEREKQRQLHQHRSTKPTAFIEGNQTFGQNGDEFAVEILVRTPNGLAASTPRDRQGQSFVKLVKDEEYVVRLHNKSDQESAVLLTIDGLSMFAFATDNRQDSLVIVPAGKSVTIAGWYVTSEKSDRFKVSEYADSAAASKSLPVGSIGVVTAWFRRCEPDLGRGAEATKRGQTFEQKYQQVLRVIDETRAIVTVRYDRDGK